MVRPFLWLAVPRTLQEGELHAMAVADESLSIQNLLDQVAIRETYDRLNHLWKLHGLAAVTVMYAPPHSRAEPMGMDHAEVERVVRGIKTFYAEGRGHDWVAEWSKAGDEYLARARDAAQSNRPETAASFYLISTACYFVGSFIVFGLEPMPAREAAHAKAVAAYREGAEHQRPPARRVDIPFDGGALPGYLRVPDGVAHPPCVVMVGGANSTKEDNHPIADYFLERGMATFLYDGPGQGEYLQSTGRHLTVEAYDRSLAAAVDWLQQDGAVDAERIGSFGKSTGGMLVLHAAAKEHRMKAVVCHPGSYNWAPYFDEKFPLFPSQLEVGHMLGARSLSEVREMVVRELTLDPVIGAVECPVLCVNGTEEIFPASEPELIRSNANTSVDVVFFPGRVHGGTPSLAYPFEADWMKEKLS